MTKLFQGTISAAEEVELDDFWKGGLLKYFIYSLKKKFFGHVTMVWILVPWTKDQTLSNENGIVTIG